MAHRLLTRFLPFLAWWPLTPLILRADLLAGVIGALVQVPKAMAYAQLAGLPLQYGLYAAFVPAIIGALWGSSRHLATGPVAVVSLMTAAAVTSSPVMNESDSGTTRLWAAVMSSGGTKSPPNSSPMLYAPGGRSAGHDTVTG